MPTIARLGRALPLAAAAGLIAAGVFATAGVLGLLLVLAILLLAAGLVVWARGADAADRALLDRIATGGLLCVPAALVVFFSFSSGGFFPDSVAIGDLALGLLLVIRLGIAERPFASIGRAALVPLVGLAGLAVWAYLSQLWSHAPGRADIGFDRDLLYLLSFALFATVGRTRERLSWALRALALAMSVVAAFALLSRVAPDVWSNPLVAQSDGRLAYPLTYWNALGVFCAIAGVLCLHLAASDERRVIRVITAGALPLLGTTLLLTYSRGGLAAAIIALAVYAVLGRPRGLLSALIATAPGTAIAVKVAYDDTLLSSANPTTPAAIHQGHQLALVVLGAIALSIGLRAVLLALDRRLEGARSPIDVHRRALRNTALGAAAVAIVIAIALGAPGAIASRWNQFVNQKTVTTGALVRNRLGSTSSNGRIELWTIAINAFDAHPIDGTGQETYEILWYEQRHEGTVVVNAHSLYIETLAELGVVGLAFVALYVLGTLIGLAPLRRARDRPLYAALFAAALAWAVHAGVDWDWQMPAVSLWLAALGGLALARPERERGRAGTTGAIVALVAGIVVVAVSVLPALVLGSQVRLNAATTAYALGDCTQADRLAARSIEILGTRAPPWQIEALCSIREGRYGRAEAQLRHGLAADPDDWQLTAALAASTAAAGVDARAQAAAALRLNPLDPGVRALARALRHGPSHRARAAAIAFLSQQSLIESG